MTPGRLCQTWGPTSSVSAVRVFLGSKQPPSRVLIALHSVSRDVRRTVADGFSVQQTLQDNSIKGSYNKPRLPASVNAQDTVSEAVLSGHLDTAVERLKRLRSDGSDVAAYSAEQLIEGVHKDASTCNCFYCQSLLADILCLPAALVKKERFQTAMSVFKLSQQSPSLQMHYFTYQSLISAATKASPCFHLFCQ